MSNQGKSYYNGISALVVLILFVAVILITFVTESHSNISATNRFMQFLVDQHIWIMASLVVVSTFFGFFWSRLLYQQVKSASAAGESVTKLLFQFLSEEEKNVLNHLITKHGKTTQAEISRMEGMNKVKSFRTIKKMEEKNLLTVSAHGKVRKITLREDLVELLN